MKSIMRDTIFISHVTPEDNEFTWWLSSRLKLAGYKVWCDLKGLKGGERDYWKIIENVIRNDSCKFLLVVSRLTVSRDGVLDEYEFAKSIAKENSLLDFVIPLRIDSTPYNARIGLNRYNYIEFTESWAKGLKILLEKFDDDKVPEQSTGDGSLILISHETIFPSGCGIIPKKETYYSNWWEIKNMPEYLFCYQYPNEEQAILVSKECNNYPIVTHGNHLVTFDDSIDVIRIKHDDLNLLSDSIIELTPIKVHKIPTTKILVGYESDSFPTLLDSRYLLKRVLKRALHLLMKARGLHWHEMSGKVNCYYHTINKHPRKGIVITYPDRQKKKALVGKYYDNKWHFGVSFKTRLFPKVCFSLKSHILFSDKGYVIWDDPYKLHSARRKKGKSWFNKEWRDLLLAFISGLQSEDSTITLNLNKDFVLQLPLLTITFESEVGYIEPVTESRQNIINDTQGEIEYYSDLEE